MHPSADTSSEDFCAGIHSVGPEPDSTSALVAIMRYVKRLDSEREKEYQEAINAIVTSPRNHAEIPDPKKPSDYSNLPDELYLALGRLTARYGLFEYQLALTIFRFSTVSRDWNEIWDWIDGFGRSKSPTETIKAFKVRTHNERQRKALHELVEEADALARRRRHAVHCAWRIDPNGNVDSTQKYSLKITIDEINELAESFHRLAATVVKSSCMQGIVDETNAMITIRA